MTIDIPFYTDVGLGKVAVELVVVSSEKKPPQAVSQPVPLSAAITITTTPPLRENSGVVARPRSWKRIACYSCMGALAVITAVSLYLTFKD